MDLLVVWWTFLFTSLKFFVSCEENKRLVLHSDGDLLQAFHMLSNKVQILEAEHAELKNNFTSVQKENENLRSTVHQLQLSSNGYERTTYVRWGRNVCPGNGTTTLYSGYVAGSYFSHSGGAANYLCLPPDPEWGYYEDSVGSGGRVYGTEYELGDNHADGGSKFLGQNVRDEDAPCSLCVSPRTAVTMIPGRLNCYPGWTKEYSGYLMSGQYNHASATEFVCVDSHVDVVAGGHPDQEGRLFYLVEGICGSLKCPPYVEGRELTCVVCSK